MPCASPPGARRTRRSASPTARRCAPPKGEPRGYDGGKRACGRKRHLLVDRLGLLISVSVGPASEHDQRGAKRLLAGLKPLQPRLAVVYADDAYAVGALHAWCRAHAGVELRVVPRPRVPRFEVLPRRWIVERTFAWLGRDRRLAKDYEWRVQTTELLIKVAMVGLMLRRLTATR